MANVDKKAGKWNDGEIKGIFEEGTSRVEKNYDIEREK